MAITEEGTALTRLYSRQQLALRAGSVRDLVGLWRTVDATNLSGTIDTFVQAAVLLARARSDDSAGLAANYYRLFRLAEQVPGAGPAAALMPAPTVQRAAAALRGSALAGILDARRAGMSVAVAQNNGFVRAAGALTKLVLSGGRYTLIHTAAVDPAAAGWARVTAGGACAFCRMLASRGPVFEARRSAAFEAHDACACTPEIAYEGAGPTAQARTYRQEWDAAQAAAAADKADGVEHADTANNPLNAYRRYLTAASAPPPAGAQ